MIGLAKRGGAERSSVAAARALAGPENLELCSRREGVYQPVDVTGFGSRGGSSWEKLQ